MVRAALLLAFSCLALAVGAATPSGSAQIRAQAGRAEVIITTTARLAGAIDSFKWDGREFINSTDHGRQLQSACSFDNTPAAQAETFNPTEAGSRRDHIGPRSTSRLLDLAVSGNQLRTRTQMAFWLAPGERSEGQLARNTNTLSDYLLAKDVRIGCGRWAQALDYRVSFTVPAGARHTYAQFEVLTGYMPPEFSLFWQFNPSTGKLEPLSDGPGEIARPVVLATQDGRYAMGIFAPPQPQPDTTLPGYGRWRFPEHRVVKWNCVFRVRHFGGLRTGNFNYRVLVPFGSVAEVEGMLREWKAAGDGLVLPE